MDSFAHSQPARKRLLQRQCLPLLTTFMLTSGYSTVVISGDSPTPLVEGYTITVADDGWYQFQRRDTFQEICAGTTTCSVTPGNYIVINHTTGQRWEPITVSVSIPVVADNTILLPNNGWYQVQDAITYQSYCEGVESCMVPAGVYHAINLTTGQRFENIEVNSSSSALVTELTAHRYSLTAAELFWKRISHRDVAITYQIYREGEWVGSTSGNSFFDDSLTADTQYQYEVRVGDVESGVGVTVPPFTDDSPSQPIINVGNALSLFKEIVAVLNEDAVAGFFTHAQEDLNFQGRTFFLSNTIEEITFSQSIEPDLPYQQETAFGSGEFTSVPVGGLYTCASGGTIENYFRDRLFYNCVAGSHTYSGTTGRRNDQARGLIRHYPFYNFTAVDNSGYQSTVSGGYYLGNESFVVLNQTKAWDDGRFTFTYPNGELLVDDFSITRLDRSNVGFQFNTITIPLDDGSTVTVTDYSQEASIEGSFKVAAEWSNNEVLEVSVSLQFSDRIRVPLEDTGQTIPGGIDPQEPFRWQTGEIIVEAADGSQLAVSPATGETSQFLLDVNEGEIFDPIAWEGDFVVDCGSGEICGDSNN